MKDESENLKSALRRRETELKHLMDQMNADKLQRSTVYRNLEHELVEIKGKIQEITEPNDPSH